MSRNIRKYKAYDQRTGRLERAIDLVEDGDKRGVKVLRREADPEHPLKRPIKIGPDRANLFPGLAPRNTYEDAQFLYRHGYTQGSSLWAQRSTPVIAWGTGGFFLTATVIEAGTGGSFLLEDGASRFLLEDGSSLLTLE